MKPCDMFMLVPCILLAFSWRGVAQDSTPGMEKGASVSPGCAGGLANAKAVVASLLSIHPDTATQNCQTKNGECFSDTSCAICSQVFTQNFYSEEEENIVEKCAAMTMVSGENVCGEAGLLLCCILQEVGCMENQPARELFICMLKTVLEKECFFQNLNCSSTVNLDQFRENTEVAATSGALPNLGGMAFCSGWAGALFATAFAATVPSL